MVGTRHRRRRHGEAAAPVPVAGEAEAGEELLTVSPFAGDLGSDLAAAAPRRMTRSTLFLAAGVVLVAGFVGGIEVQKHWGATASAATGFPSAGQNRRAGNGTDGSGGTSGGVRGSFPQGMPGAAQGGSSGAGGTTLGTVQKISGNVIYLRTVSGQTMKIKATGSTKVQVSAKGSLGDLKAGVTVVVRGSTGSGGMTATSISESSGLPGGAPSGAGAGAVP